MPLSPGFNAVTTKGSEVPKIMGYLKYAGEGRRRSPALATVPRVLALRPGRPCQGPCQGLRGRTGSCHHGCTEPRTRRGRSSAHVSHGAEGERGGWAGWLREKAKPGAVSSRVWVGFRGERQRGAGRQQHGSGESHTADSVRKKKECNLFFKKIGHSIAERQRVNERQRRLLL